MAFSRPDMRTTGCNYENRNFLVKCPLLKKWHFLDLICSVHVGTITTGFSYSNRSLLKKWHFLDPICAIYVVTMRAEVYSSPQKVALSETHMFNIGSNHYNWVQL